MVVTSSTDASLRWSSTPPPWQVDAGRILMSIPGVGAIPATSFATAIEDPDNFKKSRAVGAWLGLTTRRYQSGEVDYDGHISRRGDRHLRGLLYEAAAVNRADPQWRSRRTSR